MTKKNKPKARRSSTLGEHSRHRKTLKPPLARVFDDGVMVPSDWRARQPNMLWLAALLIEHPDRWRVVEVLGELDGLMPPTETLDGRLTSFDSIEPADRPAARQALRDASADVLPDGLGHALALLDECPGAWIYEDWTASRCADRGQGLAYLRQLLAELRDSRGEFAVHARMLALSRYFANNRIHIAEGASTGFELLARYPGGCTAEEQRHARQTAKITFDSIVQAGKDNTAEAQWGKSFWRQCARLAKSGNPAAKRLM